MASQKRLEVIIAGDSKGAKQAFDDTESQSASLADKMKSALGGAPALVGAAAIGALAGIGSALKSAYEAADAAAKVSRETERVIMTTGGAANVSAAQVSDLGDRLSDLTGIDHKVVQGAENLLLTFTNVRDEMGKGNDIFTQATGLALDMSTALGTDASGAAIQLGKALNDPIKGITALSRAGVSFTEEQKDQIKTMVQAGDTLGAQKVVIAELTKEFGGAAEAAATPLEKLQNKLSRFEEAVGAKLIPVVDSAASWLGSVLPSALETANSFLSEHTDVVEALASVGLAALAAAYGPVIAEQVAMIGTGIASFFAEAAASAVYAGEAFMTVAAQQGVLTASTQVLTYAMDSAAFALPALGLAVFAVMHFYNEGAKAADDFVKSVEAKYDTASLEGLQAAIGDVRTRMDEVGKAGSTMGERLNIPALLSAQRTYDDLKGKLDDLESTQHRSQETFQNTALAIQAQQEPAARTTEGLDQLRSQLERIAAAHKIDPTAPGAQEKLIQLQAAASSTSPVTDRLAASFKTMSDDTSSAADKVKAFKESLDALVGVHIQSQEALNKFAASMDTVAQKVGLGINLTDAFSAKNREARDAVDSAVQGAIGYSQSMVQETNDVAGATFALEVNRKKLIDTMVQHGMSRGAAEAYINTLGLTPSNIHTLVQAHTEGAVANVQLYQSYLNSLPPVVRTRVEADVGAAEASLRRFNVELNDLERRVIAGNVNYGGRFANGGIVRHFAGGGWENHVAQISNVMRVWGEPETGGEAYIPLSPLKRGKSLEILAQVAKMFGLGLLPMANGGLGGAAGELLSRLNWGGSFNPDFSFGGESENYQRWQRVIADMFWSLHPNRTAEGWNSGRGSSWGRADAIALTQALAGDTRVTVGSVLSYLDWGKSRGIGNGGLEASLRGYLAGTYNGVAPVHVHVNIGHGYVASEDDLGRTITRHLAAAQRAGVKMPWATTG